ncbi:MAG: hypothetical protein HY815_18215, partial [Candidatus Riflebacteria bacterium]|nr:hypothetical protein [Candidatus Riflebacteria bacterium]
MGSKVKTQAGLLLGTPGYMAPELIHGEPPSRSSDLYALAIVFYECLAGSPPFDDQDTWAVFKSHINDPVPSMRRFRPDLSPAFDGFFARALAKSPVDRYQGAVLFAEAVRGLPQEIRSRQLDRVGRATQDVTLSNIAVRAAGETLARPGRPPAPLWHVAGQLGRGRLWIAVSSCIVAMTLIAGLVWWRAARLGPPAQRPGPALLHPPAPVLDLSAPPPVEDDPDGKARIDALAVKARERLAAVVTEARRLSEDSRRDRRRPSRSSVARQMAAVWAKGLRDCRGHLIELGQRFGSANDARAAIEAGRLLGEIFRVWRTCEHCLDRFLDSPDGLPGSSDADGADAVLATDVYLAAAAAVAEETRRILPKALEPCRQPEWLTGRGALLGIIASAASDPSLTERRRKEMRTLFAEALPHLVARDQAPAPDPRMVELPFLALRSAGANGACASLAAGVLRELARLGDLSPRETVMAFYAWSQLAHLGRKETALS